MGECELAFHCCQAYIFSGGMPPGSGSGDKASSLMLAMHEALLHCLSSPANWLWAGHTAAQVSAAEQRPQQLEINTFCLSFL